MTTYRIRQRRGRISIGFVVGLLGLLYSFSLPVWASDTIVVGSKNFMESRLLAEMFAQLIEARTELTVTRRLGLAGTQVCFEALKTGGIDLYPEYTGTGLVTILGEPPMNDRVSVLNHVRTEFLHRWDIWWMAPLGFDNSYALALRRDQAQTLGLRTISDLTHVAPQMKAGFGYEFIQREDGLVGLNQSYGLQFQEVIGMQQTLKYQATDKGEVDILDVYTTDGRLAVYDFVVLKDDRHFFPPYEAAALVRGEILNRHPELGKVINLLTNALDLPHMRELNLRIQEQGEPVPQVAHSALRALNLVAGNHTQPDASADSSDSIFSYMWAKRSNLAMRTGEHLGLSGFGLFLGILVAIPLGLALEQWRKGAETIIRIVGMLQTIPSIALLAFMIPIFGVGALPAIMALWMYSLFPILRNTYSGLRDAAPNVVETGRALGMTEWQILRTIRLPLAAPTIMAGIRTSAIWTVGTATLAAFIGAGGLGVPIVAGLQLADVNLILSGALPATVLALTVDGVLGRVEQWARPRGLDPVH
ncbi:MAG TPA: glycine betaine ABC transporter substrate-binding protein [Nitrospirales bacterium]|nr:glycine betaine ABC transporter substrate-binding protein [Nitrospirales bacterium]